jgi:hypothetical protein
MPSLPRLALAILLLAIPSLVPTTYATSEVDFFSCNFAFWRSYFTVNIRYPRKQSFYRRCWVDPGDVEEDIGPEVVSFSSGDNTGFIEYGPGDGWIYRHYFGKHVEEYREELSWQKITRIHIDDCEEEGTDRESRWEM